MSNGSPDYTRKVKIYAWDGTNLIPVLVDDAGRIMMVPYGTAEITGDVDVTQVDSVREIQGDDGTILRTIAVDTSGNIIGVFKGDYLGSLKTIKVDSEGRMIALVTDELDIYNNKVIVGNAELAVRLGSEKFFDRRGDTYLIDNFENGIGRWALFGEGNDNEQLLSAETARSGGYSAKLIGGSTDPWYSRMSVVFPYPVVSKWGFEAHFSLSADIDRIVFSLFQDDGTDLYAGSIQYDDENDKLQYIDIDGAPQDIFTSFHLPGISNLFNVIKFVVDFETHKYVRLIINETAHDLSDKAVEKSITLGYKFCGVQIMLYSRNEVNDHVYIDNVIVTQNEP